MLQVELVRDEILRQPVQQRPVGRWVRRAEIVHRVHDAASEERVPHAVHGGTREERVLRLHHPVHQRGARIAVRLDDRLGAVRRARLQVFPGDGVLHRDVGCGPDVFRLAADGGGDALALAPCAAEERRQLVVILLVPLLARVMVALGALEPHPEENLAYEAARLLRRAFVAEERGGTELVRAALRGEQFAHEPVIRLVLPEGVAQPLVHEEDWLHAHAGGVAPDQITPLHRPMIGPGGMLQQPVDEPVALVRRLVLQERQRFLRRWQRANGVERRAANELRISAALRGKVPELLEPLVNEAVDVVVDRQCGEPLHRQHAVAGHHHGADRHPPKEACDDRAFATELAHADQAFVIHCREGLLVREILRQLGHVAHRVVRVARLDEQGLLRLAAVAALLGKHLDAQQCGLVGARVRHSLRNPVGESAELLGVALDAQPAVVRDRERGLLEQQAFLRQRREHPPAARVLHDLEIIRPRVIGKDGEFEAVLPVGLGVA